VALLLVVATAPLAAAQWAPVGPEGGTIYALLSDPDHPGVLYAGGSTVFRSADGGATWRHAGAGLRGGAFTFTLSGGVLYAGGAEGVWRSTDGGASWQPMAPLPGAPSWAAGVNVLFADPRQPGRLWAGGPWSLWLTVDGGAHWTPRVRGISPLRDLAIGAFALDPADGKLWVATRFGVFTSKGDGKRWTKASEGIMGGAVYTLAVDPAAAGVVLAGNGAGVWRRERDGAWTRQLTGRVRTLTFRGARAFAAADDNQGTSNRIYHSDDHGKTWVPAQQGPDRLVFALAGSSAGVHAGTVASDGRGGVYRSLDGGVTWQAARTGLTNLATEVVTAGPPGTHTLYAASGSWYYTELARSSDDGASWEPLTRPNATDPITELVVEPTAPDTLYAATPFSTGVFRSEDGGASWQPTPTLPRRINALRRDPRRSRALWALGNYALHHTDDGGNSWQAVPVSSEQYRDFRDLAVDPQTPAVVWVAGSESRRRLPRLFRSADGGQTWVRRDAGLGGTSVESIAIDPAIPNTLYATTDAGLYRSADAGATWARVTAVGGPVALVIAAPTSPTTIWVIAGAQREVRRSRDAGVTWESASLGLQGAPVLTLEVDPLDPQRLYAGTATRSVLGWSE
jgi:photosystem II stability/assembly factor-like uncharacterized protein